MSRLVVTRKNNVKLDENNVPEIREDGEIVLLDHSMIGFLTKTHVVSVPMTREIDGQTVIQHGLIPRAEVYWENDRWPAPALEDPADLFWISFVEDSEDSDEESSEGEHDDDAEYEEEEAEEFSQ